MNKYELIELLYSCPEDEVFIKDEETFFYHDIAVEHVEEQFDGFDTVSPACITLVPDKQQNETI